MGVNHGLAPPVAPDNLPDVLNYLSDHDGVSYQQIASQRLPIDAADITFSGIAADGQSLLVDFKGRCSAALTWETLYVRFNGDTGSNYDRQELYGQGASVGAASTMATASIKAGQICANSGPANVATGTFIWIPDYAQTDWHKSAMIHQAVKFGVTGGEVMAYILSGYWRSVAAINEIRIFPGSGNLMAGSRATLWKFV